MKTTKFKQILLSAVAVLGLAALNSCNKSAKVETDEVSDITATTAVCGGMVTGNGKSVGNVGVCWSVSQSPTVSDEHTTDTLVGDSFVSQMTQLERGTTYFVRAYAETESDVIYGAEKTFRTSDTAWYGDRIIVNVTECEDMYTYPSRGVIDSILERVEDLPTLYKDTIVVINSEEQYNSLPWDNLTPPYVNFEENTIVIAAGNKRPLGFVVTDKLFLKEQDNERYYVHVDYCPLIITASSTWIWIYTTPKIPDNAEMEIEYNLVDTY